MKQPQLFQLEEKMCLHEWENGFQCSHSRACLSHFKNSDDEFVVIYLFCTHFPSTSCILIRFTLRLPTCLRMTFILSKTVYDCILLSTASVGVPEASHHYKTKIWMFGFILSNSGAFWPPSSLTDWLQLA